MQANIHQYGTTYRLARSDKHFKRVNIHNVREECVREQISRVYVLLTLIMRGAGMSECWSLSRRNEEQLLERRILRKIFGPTCDNGKWGIRYNSELYSTYTDPDIIKTIKISKLRWTGHIMKMPEENPVKKLTLLRPERSRRAGRP